MPEARTVKKAKEDQRAGKSASTQAGEFVKEQVDKVRAGKHGVRSSKQAIAIGLSEARRAGVKLDPPAKKSAGATTRKKAETDLKAGKTPKKAPSKTRSQASRTALKKEPHSGASHKALASHATKAASKRTSTDRSAAAKKAAATKGAEGRSAAAKKAAATRARNRQAAA
jgi:hypothetical protein